MTESAKRPDPALIASISEDIEAGRLADAATMIAQVEAQGYATEELAGLKDRLAKSQVADALTGQLRAMVANGLPALEAPKNRAQRRAAARKGKGKGKLRKR